LIFFKFNYGSEGGASKQHTKVSAFFQSDPATSHTGSAVVPYDHSLVVQALFLMQFPKLSLLSHTGPSPKADTFPNKAAVPNKVVRIERNIIEKNKPIFILKFCNFCIFVHVS